jgi:hypothetical protein
LELVLGNVAHVEGGEGCGLGDCTVELVLALLDECLEVLEDVEVVFSGGQGRVELLRWGDVGLEGHGEGGKGGARGGLL